MLKRPSLTLLACMLIVAASGLIKIYINAADELEKADALFAQKDYARSAIHYERSIRWHVPGSGLQDRAAEGLWKVATSHETAGDNERALSAYRLLRSAFYSTRSFYTPGPTWIDRCNEKIAGLMALNPPYSEADKAKSFEQRKVEAMAVLTKEKAPYTGWAVWVTVGFFGWVACVLLFIFRAMNKSGDIERRQALYWSGGFILFYCLWIVAMSNV